jgi:hypothetical protein
MKKLVLLGIVFMGLVGLYSCGNSDEAKVRDVVTKFRTAIQELKFEEAGSFCEPKTAEMIKSLGGMLAMLPQENKDKLKKELFEISKVEIKGDTATVFYWEGAQIDKSVEASQMTLIKTDGVWKISMNKDGSSKEGKEGNQPEIDEVAPFGPESGNMPGAPPSPSGGVRSHNGGEMGPAQLMGTEGAQP